MVRNVRGTVRLGLVATALVTEPHLDGECWPKVIGRAGWFSLAPRPIYLPMPLDLTDDETAALTGLPKPASQPIRLLARKRRH